MMMKISDGLLDSLSHYSVLSVFQQIVSLMHSFKSKVQHLGDNEKRTAFYKEDVVVLSSITSQCLCSSFCFFYC